ncbi:MAG TPA: DinB family protein [Chitinophagales bacterium]|nr:DinB family protein [Chitinophagales bacterium]
MITQTPWLERSFHFDFPAGIFPCLLERLSGTPSRIEEMVKDVSESILPEKPGGKWSVKEHIGHLGDLELVHDGRIDDYLSGKEILRAADVLNKATNEAQHNLKSIEVLLTHFRDERMAMIRRLEAADEQLINTVAIHPRLQVKMRLADMVYFTCEHDDHHLAKMRAIIRQSF